MYYLITVNEDGDMCVDEFTKEEIIEIMEDDASGFDFWTDTPTSDPMAWEQNSLLIKGDIVVPFPTSIVTRYDVA